MSTVEERLKTELKTALGKVAELEAVLEEVSQNPMQQAVVVGEVKTKLGPRTMVTTGGAKIMYMHNNGGTKPKPGDMVLMLGSAIVDILSTTVKLGKPVAVRGITVTGEVEIDTGGEGTLIMPGKFAGDLKQGDKVLLDGTGMVVAMKLDDEKQRFDVSEDTGVSWADIGGQPEAKRQLIEAVELPLQRSEVYEFYNQRPIKGIMLYGPPGCGKTMFAKAVATSLAGMAGEGNSAFFYIKGPEILDPYVGVAEATLREVFYKAREHFERTGVRAVIMIDEADAILGRRGSRSAGGMEKTIVPAFLNEMDGMEKLGALVILATNRPDTLDPAVTREGRIDRKIRIGRPTQLEAEAIFAIHMARVPCKEDCADLITAACEMLYADTHSFYEVGLSDGSAQQFLLKDIVSGALIAGIVDHAVSAAMHRDMETGKPTGVMLEDIAVAVGRVFQQNQDVDHRDALADFAGSREIVSVTRSTQNVAA